MGSKIHFGQTGHPAVCGESHLLAATCSVDIETITCFQCLWTLQATNLRNADVIANRIKECVEMETPVIARKEVPRG